MPVIPATWETEIGELLAAGRQRLQWTKIMPLHSSIATQRDSVSKKKKKNWGREKIESQEQVFSEWGHVSRMSAGDREKKEKGS